ncbi:hypothetical protein [Thalassotalea crassostreae]|uniref:hypothetical protein n=1 Tax=Thalassotalea crassostreae TaxID=1763536 RepID=UPI000838CA3A|nr:hypothetical protein [Thalassotalea crassostreae]
MNNTLIKLVITVVTALTVSFAANAIEHNKIKFNKEMHVTIKTVTGNNYNSYDAIINKPLAQLVSIDNYRPNLSKENRSNSIFSMAMQFQDKVQYYMMVVEDTFSSDDEELESGECQNSRFAWIF